MTTNQRPDLIARLQAAASAPDLDGLIDGVVTALEGALQLWHTSLAVHVPERGAMRLLAAWSRAESAFEADTEVAISISPKIREAVEVLSEGDAVIVEMGNDGGSLVDHLMQQQGVVSALGIPIMAKGSLFVLTLGTSDAASLRALGRTFCSAAADVLRPSLEQLTIATA